MRVRSTLAGVLTLFASLVLQAGCSDDDDSGGGARDGGSIDSVANDGSVSGDDGSIADGASGVFSTPASVTMMTGLGGPKGASLCQGVIFGGRVGLTLQAFSASTCLGGAAYLTWTRSTTDGAYAIRAGHVLDPSADGSLLGASVSITSTSSGTVIQDNGADVVLSLPAAQDITIETDDYVITFQFVDDELTISAFSEKTS